jgi:hypothetical protein
MIDPQVALRAAVASALDDIRCAPDEEIVEDFLKALKDHGYVVIHEFNGTHPDVRKE